ncbi:MAG: DUF2160 family membrane protein [Polyangiales bacterium]
MFGWELDLAWMAWTPLTAAFFGAIALVLALYSVLGVRSPSTPRRGFLPLPTTRGDRLFIGLVVAAYVSLAWAAVASAPQAWAALIWLPAIVVIARWG